ncbi:hypothetical protein [Chamaesiphon sp. VAR_48_metabat_403]|uniref:hypothetical protein n=1 Tax=Chamaesiphon sp. VAR_48_metabat_403 TaxID=2964700 RepID=UPI00286E676A|nr:hypothetical protein [Chamaesiphon sp. VAR_48_metabat_403]
MEPVCDRSILSDSLLLEATPTTRYNHHTVLSSWMTAIGSLVLLCPQNGYPHSGDRS